MVKRRAIIHVSQELLISALKLPPKVEIIDARMNNFEGGQIELVLTGEGIPESEEGSYPLVKTIDTLNRNDSIIR